MGWRQPYFVPNFASLGNVPPGGRFGEEAPGHGAPIMGFDAGANVFAASGCALRGLGEATPPEPR